jgi:1,4-dihydroxy-2-naphthoyl-CoA hydrolase
MQSQAILNKLNKRCENTLMATLNIVYTEIGPDYLVATMPVDARVHQPMGLLHGGASAALAESVGSAASVLFADPTQFAVLGLELTARHIKSMREGLLTAKAMIKHRGATVHLWEITITNQDDQLISLCHLTTLIKPIAPKTAQL